MNSQNALRSKPRNLTSCTNPVSISATTRSVGIFAKRTDSSKSRRSNSRNSSIDGWAGPPAASSNPFPCARRWELTQLTHSAADTYRSHGIFSILPVFGPVVSIAVSKSAWARMPQEVRPFTKQIDLRLIPGCAEIAEIADVFCGPGTDFADFEQKASCQIDMITVASNPRSNAVTR